MDLETKNLRLVLQTTDDVRAYVARMSPDEKAQLSPAWLALLDGSISPDPWVHGFMLRHRVNDEIVGRCGFKAPPDTDGVVEIAYGLHTEHQGKGYATEAAAALVLFAFSQPQVRVVRAHTLPVANASGRILVKCGFRKTGEVTDPEDGPVWRWEKYRSA